ncbi:MAG: hypothetical protein HXX20_16495 [Chloroflexi bacterium]|nr:hypothetical protein [Chloroflexota bacterium]
MFDVVAPVLIPINLTKIGIRSGLEIPPNRCGLPIGIRNPSYRCGLPIGIRNPSEQMWFANRD